MSPEVIRQCLSAPYLAKSRTCPLFGAGLFTSGGWMVLAVTVDDDVGVIGIDDEGSMRTAPLAVVSGAVVVSVTGSWLR